MSPRAHRRFRKRGAGVDVALRAARVLVEAQPEPSDARLKRLERGQARTHDFDADAIARQDDDAELGTHHGFPGN